VWPGDSYFPDFFHPNITTYWTSMLDHLHNSVPFDGIWADMNEPTNFCDGECNWSRMVEDGTLSTLIVDDRLESAISPHIEFPYLPGGVRLESKTISPNIKHSNGALHVDVHNIYGFMNTWVTHQAQKSLGAIQTFQLTRSTFPGSGVFTQHWFGDNAATWDFLYLSVGQIFQFNVRD
jgi:alpha-glucosidase/lysosomal alpha-glucosidase